LNRPLIRITVTAVALFLITGLLNSEEVWLYNNTRVYGMVNSVKDNGKGLGVLLPTGEEKTINLEDIIAIRFLGRNPLLIQSGTQEFRFINGSSLRGQIIGNKGNNIKVQTSMAGELLFDLCGLKGFVSLPMSGYTGRKAEELVESDPANKYSFRDIIVDRRGSEYAGVVRKLMPTHLHLDIDALLQVRPIKIMYLRGVRMADQTRFPEKPWKGNILAYLNCRDGSIVKGMVERIKFNRWNIHPLWNEKSLLNISLDEISLVQIQGGKVQYLSQLKPVSVKEKTILAPPQPFQMNRSCQKDKLSIAGRRYPWGIGVHADSELTFQINKRYKEFRSDIGIATSMGGRGSVIFQVIGGHSIDSAYIYFPSEKVLCTGDNLIECFAQLPGVPEDTLRIFSHWQTLDIEKVIPGHGNIVNKEYLLNVKSYFEELNSTLKNLIDNNTPRREVFNHPSLPKYFARNQPNWTESSKPDMKWIDMTLKSWYRYIKKQ